jgi:hypothetical protein
MNREGLFPDPRPEASSVRIGIRARTSCVLVLFLGAFSTLLISQSAPGNLATITFTLDFPDSDPPHYAIAVDVNGHASYESAVKVEDDPEQQSYHSEFDVTPGTRQRIFEWSRQARYFEGKVDSGNRKLAFTGDKILSYRDGPRSSSAKYNFSNLEPVRQLTSLFQNIAATQDFGRRLDHYHRYQKLALDEELKHMEAQARNNQLTEIQGVASVLQKIVDDTSVINGVRARARELILMGNNTASGH